jgi:hypothetical protein
MRPMSAGSKIIGILGLLWFAAWVSCAIYCLRHPEAVRNFANHPWSDREILIGAACYSVIGLAGLVPAFTRLVLPLFGRSPRIGRNAAPCLASIGVSLTFAEFEAAYRVRARRELRASILGWIFAMTGVLVFAALGPWLFGGAPRPPLLLHFTFYLTAVMIGIAFRLARQTSAAAAWEDFPYLRESCRYDFFEDGFHVYGYSYSWGVPWAHIRRAERIGDAIMLKVRRQLLVLPLFALAQPGGAIAVDLLRRKVKNARRI